MKISPPGTNRLYELFFWKHDIFRRKDPNSQLCAILAPNFLETKNSFFAPFNLGPPPMMNKLSCGYLRTFTLSDTHACALRVFFAYCGYCFHLMLNCFFFGIRCICSYPFLSHIHGISLHLGGLSCCFRADGWETRWVTLQ